MDAVVLEKRDALATLCRNHHVRRLEVFGSAARSIDFDPGGSDIDFLVEFEPDAPHVAFLDLEEALAALFGRPIDLVERQAVEASRNPIRRRRILAEAEPIYGS